MHVVQFFRNLANDIIQPFKQNTIYALVGASGTGKSYNAKFVAAQYGLRAIIDDGLLIQADKILAGHSAKNEKSFLAAVRVALFDDKEHRDDIARAIKRYEKFSYSAHRKKWSCALPRVSSCRRRQE